MKLPKAAAVAALTVLSLSVNGQPAAADNGVELRERRRGGGWSQDEWFGGWAPSRRERWQQQEEMPGHIFGGWWRNPQKRSWWWQRQVLPGSDQDVAPDPEPIQGAEIYTYRPEPLVPLGDPGLTFASAKSDSASPGLSDRMVDAERRRVPAATPLARAVFDALKLQTSGVRVTAEQRRAVVKFYQARGFEPVWTSEGGVSDKSRNVLSLLSRADAEGLDAADYVPPAMAGYSDDLSTIKGDRQRTAHFELGLTAVALRYAAHASGGRIIPNRLSGYHDLIPPTVSADRALLKLAEEGAPDAYLSSLHPAHPAYAAFKTALAQFSKDSSDEPSVPIAEGQTLKPGQSDLRVPQIRARLIKLGHLPKLAQAKVEPAVESDAPIFGAEMATAAIDALPVAQGGEELYDEQLAAAVRAFQAEKGLKPDGVIGPKTIEALNADGAGQQRKQLIYSMERLRWLPRSLGSRHVLVNQASFTAHVVEGGRTIWRTKVIVGQPNTQTAVFSDEIETVVINPYWGVPESIIIHEMLPQLRNDPSYLDREGFEVVNSRGNIISSSSVDWWSVGGKSPVDVRQPPGPENALGELKFLFPNKHSIYMHDTPSKQLFSKPARTFSHGCVRVENPRKFAELLLGWDQGRIASEIGSGQNQSVQLSQKVPVHLAYFTAWPDEGGRIAYYGDTYSRDAQLETALGETQLAMR